MSDISTLDLSDPTDLKVFTRYHRLLLQRTKVTIYFTEIKAKLLTSKPIHAPLSYAYLKARSSYWKN